MSSDRPQLSTILVFAEYGLRNGGENSLLAVVQAMRNEPFRFVVACPDQTELAEYLDAMRIEHVTWNLIGADGVRRSQAEIREGIGQLIGRVKPDLIHCNSLSTSRLVGPISNQLGLPAIGYLRDIIKLSRQAISDINQLAKLVAVSQATADFHQQHGIQTDKLQVIFNGVDLETFSPRPPTGYLHKELSLPATTRLICCIGQIGMRKGTDDVIRAFLELEKQFEDLALVMVGTRNSKKDEAVEFEQRCHRLGIESNSNLFWLDRRTDVADILNESTLLLHGARQEPLGRVLLEALSVGCPFVATDVGGTAEIAVGLEDYQVVCTVDSPESMAETATKLLVSEPLRAKLARDCRKIATQRFDISDCMSKLSHLYRDTIDQIVAEPDAG